MKPTLMKTAMAAAVLLAPAPALAQAAVASPPDATFTAR